MQTTLRIGIVGTNGWVETFHLPNLSSHPQAQVTAISGRNRARAEELAGRFGARRVFTDYRQMIDSGAVDAIVVSLPSDMQYPVILEALDARLHVLADAPLTANAREAGNLHEQARAAGVMHMVNHVWRWTPMQRHLKALVDSDYVGRIYDAHMRFALGYERFAGLRWRQDTSVAYGVLGDLGTHLIDLSRWLIGDITSVAASVRQFAPDAGLEPASDSAVLALDFANGAHGSLAVTSAAQVGQRMFDQTIALHGEDGVLEARFNGVDFRVMGARRDDRELQTLPTPDNLLEGIERPLDVFTRQSAAGRRFVDAILHDDDPEPSFYDGWKTRQVLDAALESAAAGRRIDVQPKAPRQPKSLFADYIAVPG